MNRVDPSERDALTPYALLAASAIGFDPATQQPPHELNTALAHHLRLFWQTVGPECELSPSPDELVAKALRSIDPLERFLARKRAELPALVRQVGSRTGIRAAGTWSEIRADQMLSRAFDEHMLARATTSDIFPKSLFAQPSGVVVDIGGGPGHYLVRALASAGPGWRGVLLETYSDAGWWIATNSGPMHRVELLVVPPEPMGELQPAHVYILGSILHDLADSDARDLLRACWVSGHDGAWLVIIERDFDPTDLKHSSRNLDMQILFGGRERTTAEYTNMIEPTGFSVVDVIMTPDAYQVLIARKDA